MKYITMNTNCERWWGTEHSFSKWEVVKKVQINRMPEKYAIGESVVQERKCEKCNFSQQQVITNYYF